MRQAALGYSFFSFLKKQAIISYLSGKSLRRGGGHPVKQKQKQNKKKPKEAMFHTSNISYGSVCYKAILSGRLKTFWILPYQVSQFEQEAVALTKWQLSKTKQNGSCLHNSQSVQTDWTKENEAKKISDRFVLRGERLKYFPTLLRGYIYYHCALILSQGHIS